MRKCGVLLPVTSLPSEYGIGCFSKSAYDFIDWLKDSGQSYWQILPLCPTGFGDSPYQSFSTFAGNPYMISLEGLICEGLLTKEECDSVDFGESNTYIDYKKQYENRFLLLKKAYAKSDITKNAEYNKFIGENNYWLRDYSLFMALKYKFCQKVWNQWPDGIRKRQQEELEKYRNELKDEIEFWNFVQFKFYKEWISLKEYANKNNIAIIGDIPIYVSYDSVDVWANPQLFELDESGTPTSVAGCPPDGFSKTGQLWGNPLYRWNIHKKTDYEWWIKRLAHSFKLYDVLRIDHFRGFDEYYSIKFGSKDATVGQWKKGPGAELFKKAKESLGEKNIIAEDLGFITDSVKKLLNDCGFPGMKILEFAFDSRDEGSSNNYLPHNYPKNCVAYTGTHDNQTIFSWFKTISDDERKSVREYLCDRYTPDSQIHMPLIASIMQSSASLCIVPMQDWLGLDDKARINIPSTTGENWQWRLNKHQLNDSIKKEMYNMARIYERL